MRGSLRGTFRIPAALVALAVILAACGQIKAHELEAFVLQDGTIAIEGEPHVARGEALIRVQNDSRDPARIVLAKLDDGVRTLAARPAGIVDVGSTADLTYDGEDYRVVAKIDDLAPHFARGQTENTIHIHLDPGTYALFSNFPGDVASGRLVTFEVS